jgi:DNA methylase
VGWLTGLIVNSRTNHLLDGHDRVKAAMQAGQSTAPVFYVDVAESEEAYVLATFDPVGALAGTDSAALDALLREVQSGDSAVQALLAETARAAGLYLDTKPTPGAGGDDFDTTPAEGPTTCQPGDLWEIGPHRLIVGDSTDPATVARLMDGTRAAMLMTSPPYWAKQEYDQSASLDDIRGFMALTAGAWGPMVDRRVIIQTGATNSTTIGMPGPMCKVLLDALWQEAWAGQGWLLRHRRGWMKGGHLVHVKPLADVLDESWEVVLTFYRPGHNEGGQERVGEPWALKGYWDDIPGEGIDGHPCPYPLAIPTRMIALYSQPGDMVAEPFGGSGTTWIAAHRAGRICYGAEKSPQYADVIVRRAAAEGLAPIELISRG